MERHETIRRGPEMERLQLRWEDYMERHETIRRGHEMERGCS